MNRPGITPPQPWTFPTPTTTHFDNGMTVLKFDRPGQHLIDATLVLDLPLHTERASIEGVSAILQRCLDEGTRSHPRTDFAEQLENRGAVLNGVSATRPPTSASKCPPPGSLRRCRCSPRQCSNPLWRPPTCGGTSS